MDRTDKHTQRIIEQFSQQAEHFVRLPGHEQATQLLIDLAGVTTSSHVLDVACGAGAVACQAAQRARHMTGVDVTPAMIERAKLLQAEQGLSNVSWRVSDVAQLPFSSDSFDVVLTRYSFHHFLDPACVLSEMVRTCKAGGHVAVADLVLPPEKIAAYDRMEVLRDPSHVHVLTEDELCNMFQSAGLRITQRAGYFFELELEQLLAASFPDGANAARVRELFERDIGVDNLGIGVHRNGAQVRFAYPIAILVGAKAAE
jgi:ubiquinone/menaquinone biosynthesis C-methylase UbiE